MGSMERIHRVRLEACCAAEVERRPRGASRGKPAPTVCFGPVSSVRSSLAALFVRLSIKSYAKGRSISPALHILWPAQT